jgi:hypothetical protein
MLENWVRKTRNLLGMGKVEDDSTLLSTADDGSSDDDSNASVSGARGGYGTMGADSQPRPNRGYFSRLFSWMRDGYGDEGAANMMQRDSYRERHSLLSEIQTQQREREIARFHLYASCLGAALVLDIILGILTTTSRRRLRGEVDRVVIFGVTCNLILLLVAVTSLMSRRDRLSWLHQGVVYLIALAMVVVDVFLLVWAVSS